MVVLAVADSSCSDDSQTNALPLLKRDGRFGFVVRPIILA